MRAVKATAMPAKPMATIKPSGKKTPPTIGGKKTIIAVFNLPNGVSEKLNLSVTKSNKAKLTPKKDVMMAKLAKLFSNFSSCSLGTTWLIAATKTPMLPPSAIMGRNACR